MSDNTLELLAALVAGDRWLSAVARRGELLRTACSILESRFLFPNLCEQIETELSGEAQ